MPRLLAALQAIGPVPSLGWRYQGVVERPSFEHLGHFGFKGGQTLLERMAGDPLGKQEKTQENTGTCGDCSGGFLSWLPPLHPFFNGFNLVVTASPSLRIRPAETCCASGRNERRALCVTWQDLPWEYHEYLSQ